MTVSPDAAAYVNLTVFDRTATDIAVAALQDAAIKLPGVTFREGMTEVVTTETFSLVVAEAVAAINRLPGGIFTILMLLYGVQRDLGAKPVVDVTFTLTDTLGHTVPAGTEVVLDLGGGQAPIIFTTQTAVVVAPASSTGTAAAAVGSRNTVAANTIASGTALRLRSSVPFLQSAVTGSTVSGGRDAETDAVYFQRVSQRLQQLTEVLVTPAQFTAKALETPGVFRALTLDQYDPAVGPVGSNLGHTTVAVLGPAGALLSGGAKTALDATLEAEALAILNVHVIDPTITAVNVTAAVVAKNGAVPATVQTAIVAALTAYLNPSSWPWAATVRRNDLIALMEDVAGVDYVVSLTAPAADVTLTGAAPLASIGATAITVT